MKRPNEVVSAKAKKFKHAELGEVTPDIGIILSVNLQNFMCHENLEFVFDPHINFIVGRNGSGKSAILTAIILALGGKSSVTGRYSNIKGFVKTGKSKARISVTLKNCGPSAYKPDLYGDKITVEREISCEGTSSYKLKNAGGAIISTYKEDLTNILIAMDIQIDNPVLVLTQETSRSFLNAKTGKEEKLYEFFHKGTGLQKLDEEYQLSVATIEACANELKAKKRALDAMEKEVKHLEKLKQSDEKLDELKRESFWARVISMEEELEVQKIAKDKVICDIEITKNKVEECENQHIEESSELEKLQKERAEVDEKCRTERKSLNELSNEFESCGSNVRKCQGLVDLYKREKGKLAEDIRVIEEAIYEHQTKDQTDYENERKKREDEISGLEERISNAANQQAEYETQYQNLYHEQNLKHQDMNRLKAEINQLGFKKKSIQEEYAQMKNSQKNRQYLFGEHTPQILQEIERNLFRFRKPPKGPIGLDIEVKDPNWISAVEACIKPNMLRSFCVDNSEDSVLMTQILQKYYTDRMPSVIVSPFLTHVHDVSQHKAQTNFPTVLDMLIVNDPVIANCLIDQLSIENVILIDDITTAQNIMLDRPPQKCYSAFLKNCDEILLNPYRHYSASRKPTNVLSRHVDDNQLEKLKQEIIAIDADIRVKGNEFAEVELLLQSYPNKMKNLEKGIINLKTKQQDAHVMIKELSQFEEPRNVPEMYEEYQSLKVDLEKKQEELSEAEEKLAVHELRYSQFNEKLKHQTELVKSLRSTFESLGISINKCGRDVENLKEEKKKFEKELKTYERSLTLLEREIEQADEGIKKTIADRKIIDKKPRILTKRSYDEIDMQIEEMQKVISEQSNSTDKASLYQKYNEKQTRLERAKGEYKQIQKENTIASKMMKKRQERTKRIFKYTQATVTPKQDAQESGGKKSCSSLSGGERSFVTISFLLSLWDRIQMPFRILDEYDVFMDANNRHLSINLLISNANQRSDVQFIFLSPLDLPELKDPNINVKVHKMAPPERIGLTNMEED